MPHTDSPPESPSVAPSNELCLSDILAHRSSVLWHEAVGVVLGVAEAAGAGEQVGVPPVDAVFLAADGSIRIEAHTPSRKAPVRQLRGWLNDLLLEAPAPPPLSDLAQEAESSAMTVEEFVNALHYFARPNRREELAALARRIQAERQVAPFRQELAALTAKISQPKPPDGGPERRSMVPRLWSLVTAMGRNRVVLIAAAGTMTALAFPVLTWRAWVGPAPLPASRSWPVDLVAPHVEAPETPAPHSRKPRRPSVSFQRSAAGASPRTLPPVTSRALPSGLATAVALQAVPASPSFSDSGSSTPPEPESVTEPSAPAPTVAPAPSRAFTPDDLDVVQPVLLSSSLPTPSFEAPESVTVIDLVIDEHGRVVHATLASPIVRFEERMLLSAVKAWRFRPATKDGVPVKYRTRLTLTF